MSSLYKIKPAKIQMKSETIAFREKIEGMISKHGYKDYKWIDPRKFVVSQWVRIKCRYSFLMIK
jgi:hypothetical protein